MNFEKRKRKPNLGYLKVWGFLAKFRLLDNKRKNIGPKTIDSIFISYALDSNASRFLVINLEISKISNSIIIESRDAIYFENIFRYKTRIQNKIQNDNNQIGSSNKVRIRDK